MDIDITESHRLVFICGLHRSGTSVLHEILRGNAGISGFSETGFPKDEGQHIQSVLPTGRDFGGPGAFGFQPGSHFTENHPLQNATIRKRLLNAWLPYWDLDQPILVEKSPPNILRTRFLQAMFPNACFIVIRRHPIAVSLATQKWSKSSLASLINHWLHVHEIFEKDKPYLANLCTLSYEELIFSPTATLDRIGRFVGVQLASQIQLSDENTKYLDRWNAPTIVGRIRKQLLTARFETAVRNTGYSLRSTSLYPSSS
jgi:hypothetical protein